MAEKIVIAQLDIDVKSLVEGANEVREAIKKLKNKIDDLIASGQASSQQFKDMKKELAKLNEALGQQAKAIKDAAKQSEKLSEAHDYLAKSAKNAAGKQASLTSSGQESSQQFKESKKELGKYVKALEDQVEATKKAIKQTDNLSESHDDLAKSAKKAAKEQDSLSDSADDASSNLKKLSGAITSVKTASDQSSGSLKEGGKTFSEYKKQTIDAFQSINVFNGGIKGLKQRAQEAGGMGPLLKNAFKDISEGIGGMTKASDAFTATPIGAILKGINLAIDFLNKAFKDFRPVMDKVAQVTAAAGAVFDSIKNSLLDLINVFNGSKSILSWFTNAGEGMATAAQEAYELKKAQQELADSMALQEIRNAEAQKSIEEYTQASEDQTKSEQERLEALKKANETESKNLTERKKHSEDAYQQAIKAIKAGSNLTKEEIKNLETKGYEYAQHLQETKSISQEEIDALKEAQLNRIALQTEEQQLTKKHFDNINTLNESFTQKREEEQKKREQIQQQAMDKALERQQQLLDLFEAENSEKAKTLQQKIAYEQEYAKKSIALLDEELKQKKISQLEYKTAVINIQKELGEKTFKATQGYVNAELELWKQEHQSKIDGAQVLTDALIKEEAKRLEELRQKEIDALFTGTNLDAETLENKRANNEQLSQQETEYYTELLRIRQEYDETIKANDAALVQSNKEQKQNEIQNEVQAIQEKAAAAQLDYEVDKANAQSQYEQELIDENARYAAEVAKLDERKAQGLINEQQYNDLLKAEAQEHEDNVGDIKEAAMERKLSLASSTFGNMSTILGKESKAGKAMAVAQATIDTYQSAVSAFKSLSGIPIVGPALGAAAAGAAVATGLANIKKITSTKTPKAEKGALFSIGGQRHSAGGTLFTGEDGTRFEAEKGELIGVMNRNAARHFMAFNNTFPAGRSGSGNYFESGGIVSREIAPSQINMQELANLTVQAVKSIPPPVVAVEDILTQGNSYVQVRDNANF
ncbi:hypothetical protein [Flavobacterium beibuense]|uniref:Phage tail tape measure protein, TP901 family n=1 Tax=Flavobacterium beibuense TaxID=657326 RepID=A0A444WFA8_9FLAO|nr:hypothetical protein [Flavobacterium beibuense]RYJ44533.1 Phage tail tape measure protein, TP901 family [Flavobacterium beibuense]